MRRTGLIRRRRAQVYPDEDARAVFSLLDLSDGFSCKRLRVAMNDTLSTLRRQGLLRVSAVCCQRLRVISPSTPLTASERQNALPDSSAKASPSRERCSDIKIFNHALAEWDDDVPGFVEMDLVVQSGDVNSRLNSDLVRIGKVIRPQMELWL